MSVPPPNHLSPSSWNAWEVCPAQWRWKYVDGHRDPPSDHTEIGSFVHKVLELLFKHYLGNARTLDEARSLARMVWAEPGDIDLSVCPPEKFRRRAWTAIAGLWELEHPDRVAVVATERRVRWELQGVPMVVIVDRVERNSAGLLAVADYKSGKLNRSYTAKERRQVVLGTLAAAYEYPGEHVAPEGRLLYTAAGGVVKVRTDELMQASVAAAAENVWRDILEACEWDEFPPTPGPLCAWCSKLSECEEGQRMVEVRLPATRRRAVA